MRGTGLIAAMLMVGVGCNGGGGDVVISDQRFPPDCEVLWPPADGEILDGEPFDLTVSVSDRDTPADELTFRAVSDLDGIFPGTAVFDDLGAILAVDGQLLQEGYHTVTVAVSDEAHVTECLQSFYIKPNTDPSINIGEPDPDGIYLSSENIFVDISTFDAEDSDLSVLELEWNGIAAGQPTAPTNPDSDGSSGWFLPRLPAGNYSLGVRVTDSVGGTRTTAVTFDVIATDGDGDGWIALGDGGLDCDDSNFAVHPGHIEQCNGVDDDCDGEVDEDDALNAASWWSDGDLDGFGDPATLVVQCAQPSGFGPVGGDCDDADATLNPDADETCDDIDNDCNGLVDDEPVDGTSFYIDADGDTFGDLAQVTTACQASAGVSPVAGDCDDSSAIAFPGASEVCGNAGDDDCDGAFDEGCYIDHCGVVGIAQVWGTDGIHRVTCPVDVQTTLTIQAGTEVRFEGAGVISVGTVTNGRLLVQGSAAQPVVFMPVGADPAGGLVFGADDTGSVLEHFSLSGPADGQAAISTRAPDLAVRDCALSDGSGSAIEQTDGGLTMERCDLSTFLGDGIRAEGDLQALSGSTVSNVLGVPLVLGANDIGAIAADNDFTGNWKDEIHVLGAVVRESVTWEPRGVPYLFLEDVPVGDITNRPVLTLAPGVELSFAAQTTLNIGTIEPGELVGGTALDPAVLSASDWDQPWGGLVFGEYNLADTVSGLRIVRAGDRSEQASVSVHDTVLTLDEVSIEDGVGHGIYVPDGAEVSVTRTTFLRNAAFAVEAQYGRLSGFDANVLADNGRTAQVAVRDVPAFAGTSTITGTTDDERIVVYGMNPPESATWNAEQVPYRFWNNLEVNGLGAPVLTLTDGIELQFSKGHRFEVGDDGDLTRTGGLIIEPGSLGVLLTSAEGVPAAGDWIGVQVSRSAISGMVLLDGVTVEYAGFGGSSLDVDTSGVVVRNALIRHGAAIGLRVDTDGGMTMDDSIIEDHQGYAVSMRSYARIESFTGNTLQRCGGPLYIPMEAIEFFDTPPVMLDNAPPDIVIKAGNPPSSDTTLRNYGVPWRIEGTLEVHYSAAPTLTIEAGNELYFDAGQGIQVRGGHLSIEGTSADPVWLGSSAAVPAPGDWIGIWTFTQGTLEVRHATVSHAGAPVATSFGIAEGNITVGDRGTAVLSDVHLQDSAAWGFYQTTDASAVPVMSNVTYSGNTLGDAFIEP